MKCNARCRNRGSLGVVMCQRSKNMEEYRTRPLRSLLTRPWEETETVVALVGVDLVGILGTNGQFQEVWFGARGRVHREWV